MIISILASTNVGGIGNRGTLPWPHNKEDLQWFAKHTTNNIVVMGRKTWEDPKMPKPLPGRITYVATSKNYLPHTSTISGDIKEELLKLEQKYNDKIIWVICPKAFPT